MYETIIAIAASLSATQSIVGLLGSAVGTKILGSLTGGPPSVMKGLFGIVHVAAIVVLLFFTYAAAINLRPD